ncbi:BTAD domain-containing putative transcriptional regulator [Micromonospora sp. LOL_023]|uniref:BTAD domain-containing putative transcriptional regulator n=1 Tax=Micromonospora sp. LOL_023 TaxID=3345418 RepID=UPI003A8AD2F1
MTLCRAGTREPISQLALHRAGRSAEAVTIYHQRRVWLSSQLGVDPAPASKRLHSPGG